MATHKFTWEDKTTVEFEEFTPNVGQYINCRLPDNGTRGRYLSARIYVTPTDLAVSRKGYSTTPAERSKIRVGILTEKTSHPFPKGIYIPFILTNYGEADHKLENLYGDYIFNDTVKEPEPKTKELETA